MGRERPVRLRFQKALKYYAPNQIILFAVTDNKITVNTTTPLTANRGPVLIDGGTCINGTPGLTIDGNGLTGNGLVLGAGIQLRNLTIKGFTGRNLVALAGGGNKIGTCVVVRR